MEWKYDDDLCVGVGQKQHRSMCFLSVNAMTKLVRRRWTRTWDVMDEKERTMDVIKGPQIA